MSWKDIIKTEEPPSQDAIEQAEEARLVAPMNAAFRELGVEPDDFTHDERTGETIRERRERIRLLGELFPNAIELIRGGKYKSWGQFNTALDNGAEPFDGMETFMFIFQLNDFEDKYEKENPQSKTNRIKRLEKKLRNAKANLPKAAQSKLEEQIRQLKESKSRSY